MKHTIYPLHLGDLTLDRSYNTYMQHAGELVTEALIGWLILGGPKPVLVDSGAPDAAYCAAHQRPIQRGPSQTLEAALRQRGLGCEEIGLVVLSHLHWDHAGGLVPLGHAETWVQREELRCAIAPIRSQIRGYDAPEGGSGRIPFWLGPRFKVIEGDLQIWPGLSLVLTPGHSDGSQTVLVDTARGRVALAGDNVPLFENWQSKIPNAIHSDLKAAYRSLERLAALDAMILPSHDPRLLDEDHYG